MILTDSQRGAVNHTGNVTLVACPGSGKTRTLVAKLARCIEEVRGSSRKIACLTYTNTAALEVEKRLKALSVPDYENYCEISTIHAFCLSNVLHFFYWKLQEYQDGFEVLPPDSDLYKQIVRDVCSCHSLGMGARDSFELLNREPDGTPITTHPLTEKAAMDFWQRLEKQGLIDFPNIVYRSFQLMTDYPEITRAIACKFAWFLIDEFQDTSALQVEILKDISQQGLTRFFLVGDPYQSIFGFAGARPELFDEFSDAVSASKDFKLLENWRSSKMVIHQAELLCPRNPPMTAKGKAAVFTEEPLYIHAPSAFTAIIDYLLPTLDELNIPYGEAAILAPWWIKLLHLGRKLREYDIPIMGPGARPYKRNTHLIAPLAEELSAYLVEPTPDKIPVIEKEVFWLLSRATGFRDYSFFSYKGRVIVFQLIETARQLRETCAESGVDWLRTVSSTSSNMLHESGLLPNSAMHLLSESAEDMLQDMESHGVDTSNLSIADLGLFARHTDSIRLLTMHKAKGMEFDAVTIIDLHDGKVPHYSMNYQNNEEDKLRIIEEGQRLLYVAITRARRLLMYITDNEDFRNNPSQFLGPEYLDIIKYKIVITN